MNAAVLDTSVAIAWYLQEVFATSARHWQAKLLSQELTLFVPSLHFWEVGTFCEPMSCAVSSTRHSRRRSGDSISMHLTTGRATERAGSRHRARVRVDRLRRGLRGPGPRPRCSAPHRRNELEAMGRTTRRTRDHRVVTLGSSDPEDRLRASSPLPSKALRIPSGSGSSKSGSIRTCPFHPPGFRRLPPGRKRDEFCERLARPGEDDLFAPGRTVDQFRQSPLRLAKVVGLHEPTNIDPTPAIAAAASDERNATERPEGPQEETPASRRPEVTLLRQDDLHTLRGVVRHAGHRPELLIFACGHNPHMNICGGKRRQRRKCRAVEIELNIAGLRHAGTAQHERLLSYGYATSTPDLNSNIPVEPGKVVDPDHRPEPGGTNRNPGDMERATEQLIFLNQGYGSGLVDADLTLRYPEGENGVGEAI